MNDSDMKISDLPQELQEFVKSELKQKADNLDAQRKVRLHYYGDESFLLPPINGHRRSILPKQSLLVEDWPEVRKLPSVAKRITDGVLVAEAVPEWTMV